MDSKLHFMRIIFYKTLNPKLLKSKTMNLPNCNFKSIDDIQDFAYYWSKMNYVFEYKDGYLIDELDGIKLQFDSEELAMLWLIEELQSTKHLPTKKQAIKFCKRLAKKELTKHKYDVNYSGTEDAIEYQNSIYFMLIHFVGYDSEDDENFSTYALKATEEEIYEYYLTTTFPMLKKAIKSKPILCHIHTKIDLNCKLCCSEIGLIKDE